MVVLVVVFVVVGCVGGGGGGSRWLVIDGQCIENDRQRSKISFDHLISKVMFRGQESQCQRRK